MASAPRKRGEVVLVNRKGNAVSDDTGKKYRQKLEPSDNPKQIAGRLTKELRSALRGKNTMPAGFSGPIVYPKSWNVI
jgi:hypothetical protein